MSVTRNLVVAAALVVLGTLCSSGCAIQRRRPVDKSSIRLSIVEVKMHPDQVRFVIRMQNEAGGRICVSEFSVATALAHIAFEDEAGNRVTLTRPRIIADPAPTKEDYVLCIDREQTVEKVASSFAGSILPIQVTSGEASGTRVKYSVDWHVSAIRESDGRLDQVPVRGTGTVNILE